MPIRILHGKNKFGDLESLTHEEKASSEDGGSVHSTFCDFNFHLVTSRVVMIVET